MEEQIKLIITACITANIPLIAQAVAEELTKKPQQVQTVNRMEAARQLGISLPTIDELIKKGTIRARKIGRRVVIPQTEIENLLAAGEPIKYRRA